MVKIQFIYCTEIFANSSSTALKKPVN